MLVAMGGATLQSLHPDSDIVLGVGISSPVVTERWHGVPYGDRPLARTREYVTLLRECLTGESVTFEGDYYECSRFRLGVRLGDRRPKIVVGALNPRMLRLAGEVADGVLLNYLPSTHVEWSVEQVRAGEAAAGRAPGSTTIYAYVHLAVAARARRNRPCAARSVLVRGRRRVRPQLRTGRFRGRRRCRPRTTSGRRSRRCTAAVGDDFVDAIDIMGDADHVHASMQAYVDAGVDVPILMPLPWGPGPLAGHRRHDACRDQCLTARGLRSRRGLVRQGRRRHRRCQRHRSSIVPSVRC